MIFVWEELVDLGVNRVYIGKIKTSLILTSNNKSDFIHPNELILPLNRVVNLIHMMENIDEIFNERVLKRVEINKDSFFEKRLR